MSLPNWHQSRLILEPEYILLILIPHLKEVLRKDITVYTSLYSKRQENNELNLEDITFNEEWMKALSRKLLQY